MKQKLISMWCCVAAEIARLSTCERKKVGCMLISMDGERVLAYGYNGAHRGGPNVCPFGALEGACGCVHAELNALVKTRPSEPFVAIVTMTPCYACAQALINAKCKAVIAVKAYRDLTGWELLGEVPNMAVILLED